MMGLTIDTAHRWKCEYESVITDTHYQAMAYHSSAVTIRERLTEKVWNQPHYRQLPPWARGELYGIEKTLANVRYHATIPVHYLDGRFVKSEDVPKGRWADIPYGIQVWKDRPWRVYMLTTTEWKKNESTGLWEDTGFPAPARP